VRGDRGFQPGGGARSVQLWAALDAGPAGERPLDGPPSAGRLPQDGRLQVAGRHPRGTRIRPPHDRPLRHIPPLLDAANGKKHSLIGTDFWSILNINFL